MAVLLAGLICQGVSHAGENTIFIKQCCSCHRAGGEAPPINPADKAGLVWFKYFQRKRHPVNLGRLIRKKDMHRILLYLKKHAADSEHPVAAAIPQ